MDFCFPVGKSLKEYQKSYYIASGFLCPAYKNLTGYEHPGIDLNGIGGGDSDLGDLVYSISDGFVLYSGFYKTWGNIILIKHSSALYSQYAHLSESFVNIGDSVGCGDKIGTIGKGANNRFVAHLHFELRVGDLPPDSWPNDKDFIKQNYLNPVEFFNDNIPKI